MKKMKIFGALISTGAIATAIVPLITSCSCSKTMRLVDENGNDLPSIINLKGEPKKTIVVNAIEKGKTSSLSDATLSSSDTSIATIYGNKVTFANKGSVSITVKAKGYRSVIWNVTVTDQQPVPTDPFTVESTSADFDQTTQSVSYTVTYNGVAEYGDKITVNSIALRDENFVVISKAKLQQEFTKNIPVIIRFDFTKLPDPAGVDNINISARADGIEGLFKLVDGLSINPYTPITPALEWNVVNPEGGYVLSDSSVTIQLSCSDTTKTHTLKNVALLDNNLEVARTQTDITVTSGVATIPFAGVKMLTTSHKMTVSFNVDTDTDPVTVGEFTIEVGGTYVPTPSTSGYTVVQPTAGFQDNEGNLAMELTNELGVTEFEIHDITLTNGKNELIQYIEGPFTVVTGSATINFQNLFFKTLDDNCKLTFKCNNKTETISKITFKPSTYKVDKKEFSELSWTDLQKAVTSGEDYVTALFGVNNLQELIGEEKTVTVNINNPISAGLDTQCINVNNGDVTVRVIDVKHDDFYDVHDLPHKAMFTFEFDKVIGVAPYMWNTPESEWFLDYAGSTVPTFLNEKSIAYTDQGTTTNYAGLLSIFDDTFTNAVKNTRKAYAKTDPSASTSTVGVPVVAYEDYKFFPLSGIEYGLNDEELGQVQSGTHRGETMCTLKEGATYAYYSDSTTALSRRVKQSGGRQVLPGSMPYVTRSTILLDKNNPADFRPDDTSSWYLHVCQAGDWGEADKWNAEQGLNWEEGIVPAFCI